ncbi:type 1 glutamine amidotransferase [Tropicimonas sp. IMCC34043]|uniref:type 1 glutamine amidotransferase n=1 Tax=Tropicimonas sp. IMCC34043 TaxID=2248760 RepID=UPI000E2458F8|nr:type 1 glutamine amidotransferase [Tropicimonas sp. IMCC34043]
MLIGILQTGHVAAELQSEFGEYADMFQRLLSGRDFAFQTWNVVDGEFPPGPEAADGWIITGSRHGVYEDHPWIPPLEDLVRAIRDSGRPLVGICFGHQIIAQALGGKVVKFPGGWSVGRTDFTIDGAHVALNAWHQDQVVVPPPGAETIGSSEFCEHAALAIGDSILTLQPHPEFDAGVIGGLIRVRGDALPGQLTRHAADALEKPTDNDRFAQRIGDFLARERG